MRLLWSPPRRHAHRLHGVLTRRVSKTRRQGFELCRGMSLIYVAMACHRYESWEVLRDTVTECIDHRGLPRKHSLIFNQETKKERILGLVVILSLSGASARESQY